MTDFPLGVTAPKKVRLYRRGEPAYCFILQWWDPVAKATLSDRVDDDLVAAISRARQIEERLINFKSSAQWHRRRLTHLDLVAKFTSDLRLRADVGDIDWATAIRYETALRYYLSYCDQPATNRNYPYAAAINRAFRLAFTAFLAECTVTNNGRKHAVARPMKGQRFVLDTVRAMYEWAADPDRGGLIGAGFRNPFRRSSESRIILKGDPLAEPDITLPMALDLINACDALQLRLFVPLLLFGLRAAEPRYLFAEHVRESWIEVPCTPELNIRTKGRRDKRFPLLPELDRFWDLFRNGKKCGLIYERRAILHGNERAPMRGLSLADLIAEYQQRIEIDKDRSAVMRYHLRDQVLRQAGAITYDHIQGEFERLTHQLGWPAAATLKDLRHLFATTMNNAAMPEAYRRYLMGQAPGKAAVVAYTHLNELQRHYSEAVRREWAPLIETINRRVEQLLQMPTV